jgi:hypothetical protein
MMRSTRVLAALAVSTVVCSAQAADTDIRQFFWPEHMQAQQFKVRSHGLNGRLDLAVGDTVEIDGKQYREVRTAGVKGYPGKRETIYMRADDKAIYSRYSKDAGAAEVVELSLPIEVGSSWKTVDRDGKPSERTITKIGPCKTREGLEFERCVRVDYRWQELGAVSFYSPGDGEVIFSGDNGFFTRRVLRP